MRRWLTVTETLGVLQTGVIIERKPFFEIPDADWLRLFEVNVMSGVRFARLYASAMARLSWG